MNVALIGFSGTGKSTTGQALACRLGCEFVDTDAEVERVSGKRIHQIFAEEGEPAFRRLEAEAVRRAVEGGPRVVSVGGGAVVDPANRRVLREGALVVLLEAGVDTIYRRLAEDVQEEPRPLLATADPRARMAELKAARDPIYHAAAHAVVCTDGLDAETVAERVAALVAEEER